MAPEIRPLRNDAEFAQHHFISNYAFNSDRGEESAARRSTYYDRDWCLGAFDGDELVAGLVIIPFEQYINGARIPVGGIASVSCLPERRRGGFVSALLQAVAGDDARRRAAALVAVHAALLAVSQVRLGDGEPDHQLLVPAEADEDAAARSQPGSFRRVGPGRVGAARRAVHAALRAAQRRLRAHRAAVAAPRLQRLREGRSATPRSGRTRRASRAGTSSTTHSRARCRTRRSRRSRFASTTGSRWTAMRTRAILNYLLGHDLSGRILMLASPRRTAAGRIRGADAHHGTARRVVRRRCCGWWIVPARHRGAASAAAGVRQVRDDRADRRRTRRGTQARGTSSAATGA